MIIFLSLVSTVMLSTTYYVALRLTQPLAKTSWLRPTIWITLFAWALMLISGPVMMRVKTLRGLEVSYPQFFKNLMLVAYGFMGFIAIIVFSILLIDIVKFVLTALFITTENRIFDPARRDFLLSRAPWGAFGLSALLSGWGYKTAMAYPKIKKVKLPKNELHASLEGFKILQISDLHVGTTIKKAYVDKVVELAMEQKPDLIAITGDMVDGDVETLSPDLEALKKLSAPYGIYYVTGNHEYYWGAESWIRKFQDLGFEVLHNKHKVIHHKNSKIVISGVPDLHVSRFNPQETSDPVKAMTNAPANDFSIMLAHQPASYKQTQHTSCNLQLSGHTHAGQFYPVGFAIRFFHKYYKGLNRHNENLWVYVNQGTGYWGPPNRLGIPSEITLIELAKA